MEQFFIPAAQLGGTVFTVIAFLRYLSTRDSKWETALLSNAQSNLTLARSLQKLTDKVGTNITTTLANTARVDKNTTAVQKNKPVVEENTGAIQENTGVIVKNGKH